MIRPFCNADLPALTNVWIEHWSTVGPPPEVSPAMIEQAILSRTFFDRSNLLVAESEDEIRAWCHFVPLKEPSVVVLASICFSPDGGLGVCDQLLEAAEAKMRSDNHAQVLVGPLRDTVCGYGGLAPHGHGIGVPVTDTRTASLLSRAGYAAERPVERLQVSTSPYRPPVSREFLQLRRTTRLEFDRYVPEDAHRSSAMSHLDLERHRLVNHRSGECLATVDLWTSDPEAQVMAASDAILSLHDDLPTSELEGERLFLIASIVQSLSNRRIFRVETAVNQNESKLIDQLKSIKFEQIDRGVRWEKTLA